MQILVDGIRHFQQNDFPARIRLFKRLAKGQQPIALLPHCGWTFNTSVFRTISRMPLRAGRRGLATAPRLVDPGGTGLTLAFVASANRG